MKIDGRTGTMMLALLAASWGAAPEARAQTVERGPYLQVPTSGSMVIRWRTDVPTDSRVSYGASPGSLGTNVDDPALVTDHEVEVSGLTPNTQYFYSVGTTTTELAGNDADHSFRTSPSPGASQPIRFWALGDSGFADPMDCLTSPECDAPAVRDAYLGFPGANDTDLNGILLDTSARATIRGNKIWENAGEAIDLDTPTGPASIVNNTVTQNGRGGTQTAGLRLFGTGNQIDRNVNPTLFPPALNPQGAAAPEAKFDQTYLLLYGFNAGMEVRW